MPNDAKTISAKVTLTEQDLADGIITMSVFHKIRWLIVALLVVVNIVAWRTGALMSRDTLTAQVITFVAFVGFAFWGPRLSARRQLAAMAKAGEVDVTYTFDAEGVTINSSGGATSMAYRELVKIVRGKSALLLYTAPQVARVVPLRAFSDEDRARVLAWLPSS